jgi:hypothetical protein
VYVSNVYYFLSELELPYFKGHPLTRRRTRSRLKDYFKEWTMSIVGLDLHTMYSIYVSNLEFQTLLANLLLKYPVKFL